LQIKETAKKTVGLAYSKRMYLDHQEELHRNCCIHIHRKATVLNKTEGVLREASVKFLKLRDCR
jgi:hypothetical protein